MNPGDLIKLNKPELPVTFGQGAPPEGITITYPDKVYFLKYGTVFKVSENCDKQNKIADLDVSGHPLIHIDFIKEHNKQFILLETKIRRKKDE